MITPYINNEQAIDMLTTSIPRDYPGAEKICQFAFYFKNHPHEVRRSDGSRSVYYYCRGAISFANRIAKYGEHYLSEADIYTFTNAKRFIRRTARKVDQYFQANKP